MEGPADSRRVHQTALAGNGTRLCRADGKQEPGARYPAHVNAGPEDFFILTGDLVIGERKMRAGDFHHADSGSQHAENYSVEGCTLLAVLTTDDPLVSFAMA